MRTFRLAFGILGVIALSAQLAAADTVLVRTSTATNPSEESGYGVLGSETITGMLDAATGNQVTTVASYANNAQIQGFDFNC